ncbi:hypothetical protein [Leeuwenhoekiella nanhaiensis]|nr:hypothetical protein [Leeuwenhoekiella nanhaiensis]
MAKKNIPNSNPKPTGPSGKPTNNPGGKVIIKGNVPTMHNPPPPPPKKK